MGWWAGNDIASPSWLFQLSCLSLFYLFFSILDTQTWRFPRPHPPFISVDVTFSSVFMWNNIICCGFEISSGRSCRLATSISETAFRKYFQPWIFEDYYIQVTFKYEIFCTSWELYCNVVIFYIKCFPFLICIQTYRGCILLLFIYSKYFLC